MPYISQEAYETLAQNLQITAATVLNLLQGLEVKPDQRGSGKAVVLMLGCIAMTLTTIANILLATTEKANITLVKPS